MIMKKLLIIEDEEFIRAALEDDFRLEGYEVKVAADGATGLQNALEKDIDLIIDDTNRAPNINVSSHTVVLGETLDLTVAGDDPDTGAVLTYSVRGLPELATFDENSGQFQWTPGPGQKNRAPHHPIPGTHPGPHARRGPHVELRQAPRCW